MPLYFIVYFLILFAWFWIVRRGGAEWLAESYSEDLENGKGSSFNWPDQEELTPDTIKLWTTGLLCVGSIWLVIFMLVNRLF